jgi:hypothetical protein
MWVVDINFLCIGWEQKIFGLNWDDPLSSANTFNISVFWTVKREYVVEYDSQLSFSTDKCKSQQAGIYFGKQVKVFLYFVRLAFISHQISSYYED